MSGFFFHTHKNKWTLTSIFCAQFSIPKPWITTFSTCKLGDCILFSRMYIWTNPTRCAISKLACVCAHYLAVFLETDQRMVAAAFCVAKTMNSITEKLRPTLPDVQPPIHAHHLRVLLETDQRTIAAAAFCVAKKSITEKAQFLDSCYSRIFHM